MFLDQLEEMGSRSSLSRDADGNDHWDMNYHEAAIYLEVIKYLQNKSKDNFKLTPHFIFFSLFSFCLSLFVLGRRK